MVALASSAFWSNSLKIVIPGGYSFSSPLRRFVSGSVTLKLSVILTSSVALNRAHLKMVLPPAKNDSEITYVKFPRFLVFTYLCKINIWMYNVNQTQKPFFITTLNRHQLLFSSQSCSLSLVNLYRGKGSCILSLKKPTKFSRSLFQCKIQTTVHKSPSIVLAL